MPISRSSVEHLARLGHLQMAPDEIDELTAQLSSVLDHVARLQVLDTDGVEPTSQAGSSHSVMRDDVVTESWSAPAVLANAPHSLDGLFEVQAVFD